MQGCQHQMAGQWSLYRNLRGFQIADFADHNHIRVLAQDGAQGARKTHANPFVDLRLAQLGKSYSIGSSTVMILAVSVSSLESAAYRVVVFPEPVGPVTSTMPCGRVISVSNCRCVSAAMPSVSRLSRCASFSSNLNTARSPCPVGSVETRTSTRRPPTRSVIRPS